MKAFCHRCRSTSLQNVAVRRICFTLFLIAFPGHSQAAKHVQDSIATSTIQTRVGRLIIKGNKSFSSLTLKGLGLALDPKIYSRKKLFYKPAFSFPRLRQDTALIRQWYESNGFLKIAIQADTITNSAHEHIVNVRIHITEGPRTTVTGVIFSGIPPDKKLDLGKDMLVQKQGPLKIADIDADIRMFIETLGNRGYLEATANYHCTFSSDSLGAQVEYTIHTGPHIRVDSIQISGLHGVRDRVVRRELRFKEKHVLTNKQLRNTINNLYGTNLFGFVVVSYDSPASPDSLNDSLRIVRITVLETSFLTVETSIGYQTYESICGRADASYDNFAQLGIRGSASLYANYLLQGIDLGIVWPWIFEVPVTFNQTASFYHRREGGPQPALFEFPNILWAGYFTALHSCLSYQLTSRIKTSITHTLETRSIDYISASINPDSVGNPFTHSIGFSITQDSRSDMVDPHKGNFSNALIEVSGITGTKSNHYVRLEGDERVYFPLGESFIIASALRAGIERLYGQSTVVPIDQKFYIGGPDVMRGFYPKTLGSDTTGGTFYMAWNVGELRFPIYKWFRGVAFFDMGNLWNIQGTSFGDYRSVFNKPDFRYNAGAGIRIHLPIFILSLDAGFKLDKRPGEGLYAIQFNLGNSF